MRILRTLLCLLAAAASFEAGPIAEPKKPRLVLAIVIDQFRYHYRCVSGAAIIRLAPAQGRRRLHRRPLPGSHCDCYRTLDFSERRIAIGERDHRQRMV